MKKEKELAKNTILILIGKISTQFISFVMLPLYTSYLTTDEYGLVDLIITYVQLLIPVVTLGLENAAFRFLVDCRKNEDEKKKVISNIFFVIMTLSCVFVVGYYIVNIYANLPFANYIIFNIVAAIVFNMLLQIARGMGDNKLYTVSSAVSSIFTVILNIALIVFARLGAKGMVLSMAISNILAGIYIVKKLKIYQYISIKNINKSNMKELIKYSAPLVPSGISWWIVSVSDRTIISAVLGVAANGIYAISNKFASIINILTNVFTLSWTESASLYINSEGRDAFFSNTIDTAIRFFSSLCIGLIACMPLVFNIMINNTYQEAYLYIPILVIGSFFNVIVSIYGAIYVAKKLTKQVSYTSIVAAVINIIINVLLIKKLGLYAATLSTAIAYFIMVVYRHFDLKKYISIKINIKMIVILFMIYIETFICYYINIFAINIINLIFIILISIFINKKVLKNMITILKNKIKMIKTNE